ncbi:MAG: hypothetical protein AB7P37_11455 [Ramlibacter sp.]
MKTGVPALVVCTALFAGTAPGWAQDSAQQQMNRERARIAAERQAADVRYSQAEAACFARFAVNDCVNEARTARREALADLRRQEISLNDDERLRKGAAQRQRLDERSSAENQLRAAQQRARALEDAAARQERGARKAAAAAPVGTLPPQEATQPAALPAPDAAAIRKRQDKLEQARARKERLEKRRLERTKPAARPLPVPAS